ncbi:uncharacterized protein LOC143997801 isoform X2 [Lithobates pipiens]
MRTLLILGVLVVCVLLVTPSNGDRTVTGKKQQDGGEKSMDSGDLTVAAESSERNLKPLPCCRLSTRVLCKHCPGMAYRKFIQLTSSPMIRS